MNSRKLLPPILLLIAIVASWTTASASTITLSNDSNDPALDASLLAATVQFEVTSPSTLTLTVSNDSANYDIVAVFFNAASGITGLSLGSGQKNWKLEDPTRTGDPTHAGSFGTFDYVVRVKAKKVDEAKMAPGESGVFFINIEGAGPFAATDFTSELSGAGAGEVGAFSAATFLQGNDETVGAFHTPEPASKMLLGLGLVALAITGRKRPQNAQH